MRSSDVRESGFWTVHSGRRRMVVSRFDGSTVTLRDEGRGAGEYEVPIEEVGAIEKVVTTARWRGGLVTIARVLESGRVGFYCHDSELARRESLRGDQYSSWTGTARAEELEDVEETVTVLREEGAS
ncbi:hypothetical protein ACFP3Q_08435 [Nocardioides sp. GCM10027113]|uniref:hypothetical protein n=1 Tax=Nocardioides sp. GCM10027113 TaxID=3273405 RepID=UPI003623B866